MKEGRTHNHPLVAGKLSDQMVNSVPWASGLTDFSDHHEMLSLNSSEGLHFDLLGVAHEIERSVVNNISTAKVALENVSAAESATQDPDLLYQLSTLTPVRISQGMNPC